MKNNSVSAKKLTLIGFLVFVALGIFAGELVVYRQGQNPSVRQKAQKPFDQPAASHKIDVMYADVSDHVEKAARYCDRHNIWGPRRIQIIRAQYDVGKAATEKVAQSNYAAAYEPKYPPLPAD